MASRNFYEHIFDFGGQQTYSTTVGDNAPLLVKDTSAAGTPTYALASAGTNPGELKVDFDNTNEVQNVCVYQNDILQFPASKIIEVEFLVKMNQAAINAATTFSFGLASARNDALASITNKILFKLLGSTDTTGVLVDSSDGTTTKTGITTGKTLINAYKNFLISFAKGLADPRLYIDGQPVAESTVFSLAAMTTNFQLFMQLQKTASTNIDGFTVDRIRIAGRR